MLVLGSPLMLLSDAVLKGGDGSVQWRAARDQDPVPLQMSEQLPAAQVQ